MKIIIEEFLSPMKKKRASPNENNFMGKRLAEIRKNQGLTQSELGRRIGLSRRMVVYYETVSDNIPANLLAKIATALKVSADELLGLKSLSIDESKTSLRLLSKLKVVGQFPRRQIKSVLDYINALKSIQNKNGTV